MPVTERFDFWWQAVAESVVSVDASSDHAADFWAEMRMLDLGAVHLSKVRCVGFEAHRTEHRIRRSDPEVYQLSVILRGRSGIRQEDRESTLAPTDLTLYDASRPFLAWSSTDGSGTRGNMSEGLILQVPHDALGFPAPLIRRVLARRMSGRDGIGALLCVLLRQLLEQTDHLSKADLSRLSGIVVDLIVALLAHEAEKDPSPFVTDPGKMLVLRIQAFIAQHLGELDLSPADIAAAHHISLRHMQRLFQQEGHTVSGWIQQQRLERCRRALADPQMDNLPISVIAGRWGFVSDSHFNRLFHRTYGMPPAGYRRHLRKRASGA
ncbi:helix-turn-helix domain-containing protein [Nonomuraea turkmeniaca]|uniref:AraC-like ligand-binding domain-containing protein n=1 Tax=Nonomuraea turkmeniaca TaxID=103838 RepID=UPI00147689E8|nr:helix-turn-helix domain-containing protein [Nonomuraea turkmeniaca]